MAWTAPKTWSSGETLTAANFNTHIRDNELALGPHLVVRKSSDETISSNATPQDDDFLLMAVAANEIWLVSFNVLYSSSITADFQWRFTFPTGGRIDATGVAFNPSLAVMYMNVSDTTSPGTAQSLGGGGVGTPRLFIKVEGIYTNASTAGNLTFQWAQNTSDASNTVVHANSTLWAVKLA